MDICLEEFNLRGHFNPTWTQLPTCPFFPVSMLFEIPSFDPVHFGQTKLSLWTLGKHLWLLPTYEQQNGALRRAFLGGAAVLFMTEIEMGTSLNSLSELSSAPSWL